MIDSLKGVLLDEIRMDGLKVALKIHYQRFDEALMRVLPGGKASPELVKEFTKINESNIRLCWKVLADGELCFRCLDCEVIDEISNFSGQCEECFEQSHHEGHRIQKCKPQDGMTYTCDCGRVDMMRPEGFCHRHKPIEKTTEEMLVDFPKDVRQQFTERFKKVLYGIISMFEVQEKAAEFNLKDLKSDLNKLAQSYTAKLLEFYANSVEQLCTSFRLVFERILYSKFEEPKNLVWHDCNDMKDENQAKNSSSGQSKPCSCTILGCLLRFSKFLEEKNQENLRDMITESCKEKSSHEFLKREIYRHVYFFVSDPLKEDGDLKQSNSGLGEFVASAKSIENELEYIVNFIGPLKRFVQNISSFNAQIFSGVWITTYPFSGFFDRCSESDVKSIQEAGLIADILEIISEFETKALLKGEIFLGIDADNMQINERHQYLQIEKKLFSGLDHAFRKFSDFQPDVKDLVFRDIAKTWYACFEKIRPVIEEHRQSKNHISYLCSLERVLCLMIVHYLGDEITKSGLENFFRTMFPEVNPSVLAYNIIIGPLRALGLSRFAYIILDVEGRVSYYKNADCIYEIDIVLIQTMALLVDPQELFSVFVKSFFFYSEELIEFCLSFGTSKPLQSYTYHMLMLLQLKDFLELFIYIMNDEICLMNLDLRDKLSRNRSSFPNERVFRKVFVNLLLKGRSNDASSIKNTADELYTCRNLGIPVNSILSKIVTIDEQTHTIKLKKEYQGELDPYIFYKHYHRKEHYQNQFAEEVNTQNSDIVSGVYYTDLAAYLKDLQVNIFHSQLSDFASHIITNFTKDLSRLLKPALKLALFNLQVLSKLMENPNLSIEKLQNKVKTNFLNQNFANSLNKILAGGEFIECELCIKKIQDLIAQLSCQMLLEQSLEQALVEEKKGDSSEDKKRQAKEKMEKLKEEFAKKQALFAQKHEDAFNKNNESPEGKGKAIENSPDKKDLVCQYCLDRIDEEGDNEYGVPIYIEFTNNFYNTEEQIVFKEQDYSDLSKAKWWPVISSCSHYYHHKCFDEHCHNSKGPQNQSSLHFTNDVETQCALCKTLCNSFLDMNKKPDSKSSRSTSESFFLRMNYLLEDRKAKKLLAFKKKITDQEKLSNISPIEMSRRTYEYFAESFHIHEKPHTLSESFELYISFFKTLRDLPHNESIISSESRSVLNSIRKKQLDEPGARVCPETIVTAKFFDLLQEKCGFPSTEPSQEVFISEHLKIIKEYLATNLLILAQIEKPNGDITLKDIISMYRENPELRSRTTSELIFQIQKILLAFYLNKCVFYPTEYSERSDFCRLLFESQSGTEKLNLLLKQCCIPLSFEHLIEESLPLLDTMTQLNKDELNTVLNLQGVVPLINKQKFAPQYIQLPQNYMELNQKYVRQRCSLCKAHNKGLWQCVCMICGEHLCAKHCEKGEPTDTGNLTGHASKYHMGLAMFIVIERQYIIYMKWPDILGYHLNPSPYINELGEYIAHLFLTQGYGGSGISRHLDYKSFVLDKKVWEKIKNVVKNHSMGQVIFENAQKHGKFDLVF